MTGCAQQAYHDGYEIGMNTGDIYEEYLFNMYEVGSDEWHSFHDGYVNGCKDYS